MKRKSHNWFEAGIRIYCGELSLSSLNHKKKEEERRREKY